MVCTRRICTIYAVALPARKIFRNDEDEDDVVTRIYIYIRRIYMLSDNRFFVSCSSPWNFYWENYYTFFSRGNVCIRRVRCSCRTKSADRSSKNESRFVRSSWIDFDRNATLHIFRSLSRDIYIYKYTSSNTFRWYIYIHCVNFDLVIRSRVQNEPIRKIIYIVYDLCYKTFSPVPRWPIIFFQV